MTPALNEAALHHHGLAHAPTLSKACIGPDSY